MFWLHEDMQHIPCAEMLGRQIILFFSPFYHRFPSKTNTYEPIYTLFHHFSHDYPS